jgi:hypothetical protein
MAHYAKIVDGKVTNVIVAEAEYFDTFVDDSPGTWVQTSYNTHEGTNSFGEPLRKNFAAIGMNYDGIGFYENAPYPSWIPSICNWIEYPTWIWCIFIKTNTIIVHSNGSKIFS